MVLYPPGSTKGSPCSPPTPSEWPSVCLTLYIFYMQTQTAPYGYTRDL